MICNKPNVTFMTRKSYLFYQLSFLVFLPFHQIGETVTEILEVFTEIRNNIYEVTIHISIPSACLIVSFQIIVIVLIIKLI